jgi:hypothetical protein
MKKGSWLAGHSAPRNRFQVTVYHLADYRRNTPTPKSLGSYEPRLTKGGLAIKSIRPQWSHALCNTVAELAAIGQEVRHG